MSNKLSIAFVRHKVQFARDLSVKTEVPAKIAGKSITKQKLCLTPSLKSKLQSKEIHCFPIFQKLLRKKQRHRKARKFCHLAGRRTTLRRVPKQGRPRSLPRPQMAVVGFKTFTYISYLIIKY